MAVPTKITFYQKNDQVIEVGGLKDGLTSEYLNAASVTATLYDRTGEVVAGVEDLVLNHVPESDGIYRGNVPETFAPAVGGGYTLHIDAVEEGLTLHMEIVAEVKVRKS